MLSQFELQYAKVLDEILKTKEIKDAGTELACLEYPLVSLNFDLNEEFPIIRFVDNQERKALKFALQRWQSLVMTIEPVASKAENVLNELRAFQSCIVECECGLYRCTFSIVKNHINVVINFNTVDWVDSLRNAVMQIAAVTELFAIELGVEYGGMLVTAACAIIYEDDIRVAKEILDRFSVVRAISRHSQAEIMDSNLILTYLKEYHLSYTQQTLYNYVVKLLNQHARMCVDPGQLTFQSRTIDKIKFIECNTLDDYFRKEDV